VSLQTKAALEKAAPELGVRITTVDVKTSDDLDRGLADLMSRDRADALILAPTAMSLARRRTIIDFAAAHRLPTAYWEEVFAHEGGLISYGFSVAESYRRAAQTVAKVLQGVKPADIPIDYGIRFRMVVNEGTAKALGIKMPHSVLIQADEIIK
jgi:putative ABC transport system substrate-binding protein